MRILLVSPCPQDDSFGAEERIVGHRAAKRKKKTSHVPPYALLTIAGLTPGRHAFALHDENVRGAVDALLVAGAYDLVGISMLTNQQTRTLEIVEICRAHGLVVVAGGAGTVHIPAELVSKLDAVFIGEAEHTWPQFLEQFEEGRHRHIYRQVSKVDLGDSPLPRWDLVREDIACYMAGMVQTNRGCPHDCAFCDSIFIYGRRCRARPIGRVLEEVRILADMGVKAIILADDNFTADPRHAKDLLRQLADLNNSLDMPMGFTAQADIKISGDEALLEQMADCNFLEVLVGIESPRAKALQFLNKKQNLGMDVAAAVRKIQAYGIPVFAMLIAGTDEDDLTVFDSVRAFLKEASVADHVLWPLMAPTGTRLWYRLKREQRIVRLHGEAKERLGMITNIVPKLMTRVELLGAIADYWESAFDPDERADRVIGFIRGNQRRPRVRPGKKGALWRHRKVLFRMMWVCMFRVSRRERRALFRIVRVARREAPFLLTRVLVLQAGFWMGAKRARRSAQAAREQACYEQEHPEYVELMDTRLPIPDAVREKSKELIEVIYEHTRQRLSDRESVYRATVMALVDFIRAHGQDFQELGPAQKAELLACCDRATAEVAAPTTDVQPSGTAEPCTAPFVREILDGTDLELRLSKVGAGMTHYNHEPAC